MIIANDVYSKTLADEEIILHMQSGQYFGLNPAATVIWKSLNGGKSGDEIVQELVEQFDVSPAEAQADVAALIAELKSHGLVL